MIGSVWLGIILVVLIWRALSRFLGGTDGADDRRWQYDDPRIWRP